MSATVVMVVEDDPVIHKLLSDIMMPVMSGIDLMTAVAGDPELADVPVILLSAKAQAADIRSGLEAGAADYVTKPFEPLDPISRVEAVVNR